MARVAHSDIGAQAALGTLHDRNRSRAAGFVNPADVAVCDITLGPHSVKPVLPEFRGLPLGSVPPRPQLEVFLTFWVARANAAQWGSLWDISGLDEAEAVRDLPAPDPQAIHDLGKVPLSSAARAAVAHARAIRAVLQQMDTAAEVQHTEASWADHEARSKAAALLATYTRDTIPLLSVVEDPGLEEARAFLAKIDSARRLVADADKAREKLTRLHAAACEAATLLGRVPPSDPLA